MLLGKRPRGPIMRRTTSMTGITVDVPNTDASSSSSSEPSDHSNMIIKDVHANATVGLEQGSLVHQNNYDNNNMMMDANFGAGNSSGLLYHDQRLLATMVSPRNHRNSYINNSSGDFVEPAHFLRSCGLCKRRLAPGKDIYMYRGDTAFCSLECREQQMKKDETKDKCSVMNAAKKEDRHTSSSTTSSKPSSRKSETVASA